MIDEFDMRCPECLRLADRVGVMPVSRWIFYCDKCHRCWGHPQSIDRAEAIVALRSAKEAEQTLREERDYPLRD